MRSDNRFDLTGRVAIITGGAGMLGMQHAHAIAESGGHVVIADLSAERAAHSAGEVSAATGVEALGVGADITVKRDVEQLVRVVVEKFARVEFRALFGEFDLCRFQSCVGEVCRKTHDF